VREAFALCPIATSTAEAVAACLESLLLHPKHHHRQQGHFSANHKKKLVAVSRLCISVKAFSLFSFILPGLVSKAEEEEKKIT